MKVIDTLDVRGVTPDASDLLQQTRGKFPDHAIQWRLQYPGRCVKDEFFEVLPYVTVRAVIDRLDEVFGLNWDHEYSEPVTVHGLQCTIRVYLSDGRVLERSDVGTKSNIEGEKGAHSDALKRAAVHFGCGAYVYSFPDVFVKCPYKTYTDDNGQQRKSARYIPREAKHDLRDLVRRIHQGTPSLPRYDNLIVIGYDPLFDVDTGNTGDGQQWPADNGTEPTRSQRKHAEKFQRSESDGDDTDDSETSQQQQSSGNGRGFRAYGKHWPPRSEWDGPTLAEYLRRKAADLDDGDETPAPDKDFDDLRGGARAAIMSVVKCGDDAREDARYRQINQYVFDKYSSDQWTRGECVTIIAWVNSNKDDETGEYVPSEAALREAPMLWKTYQREQGQQELGMGGDDA